MAKQKRNSRVPRFSRVTNQNRSTVSRFGESTPAPEAAAPATRYGKIAEGAKKFGSTVNDYFATPGTQVMLGRLGAALSEPGSTWERVGLTSADIATRRDAQDYLQQTQTGQPPDRLGAYGRKNVGSTLSPEYQAQVQDAAASRRMAEEQLDLQRKNSNVQRKLNKAQLREFNVTANTRREAEGAELASTKARTGLARSQTATNDYMLGLYQRKEHPSQMGDEPIVNRADAQARLKSYLISNLPSEATKNLFQGMLEGGDPSYDKLIQSLPPTMRQQVGVELEGLINANPQQVAQTWQRIDAMLAQEYSAEDLATAPDKSGFIAGSEFGTALGIAKEGITGAAKAVGSTVLNPGKAVFNATEFLEQRSAPDNQRPVLGPSPGGLGGLATFRSRPSTPKPQQGTKLNADGTSEIPDMTESEIMRRHPKVNPFWSKHPETQETGLVYDVAGEQYFYPHERK